MDEEVSMAVVVVLEGRDDKSEDEEVKNEVGLAMSTTPSKEMRDAY